ncbi:MAG TPA: protein kinase [Prosthecobacter sp.]
MSDSHSSTHCQQCGAATFNAPEGLCPRCLMAQVMQPTQAGDPAGAMPPFKPEEIAPHFPQLEILECLGRGGMGVVYKARQKSLNRWVALKLLAPERADDPHFAVRFEKEALALATLNHPHIVGVYDFGQAGGFYYLLMEFVDGVNLRQLLQTKRLTPKEALSIVPPVCDALQCAHDHGIVHRDIKPENLLIDKAGKVKIADFGVAKMLGAMPSNIPPSAAGHDVASQAFGTPDYAAPEQADGQVDHRADIYSLGVVLYEMLTGERPKDKLEAPSKRVQMDIRIDEIVLRALEKTPELRFATATEFRTQVEAVTQEAPPPAAPAWTPPEAGWGWLVGKMFGITFRSRRAFQLANLSALGFLAFLGFVPLPGWQGCFGFAGFFGFIGLAFFVEMTASRSRPGQSGGAVSPTNPWPRRIFILLVLLVLIPVVLFLGVLVPVYQSTRAMARETRQAHEANRHERENAQDKKVAHGPNPSPALADGFDFPVGAPDGKGYHISREAFSHAGQKTEHTGEDWDGDGGGNSDLGDPVYAVADGLVMFSKDAKLGHGNVIIVQHTYQEADGRQAVCESSYHHLLERLVETGARVKRGQKIGTLGSNSGMYPSHLHFELRKTPGMGLEQSPFKRNTENYWQPSQFIREHRPQRNHEPR